MKWPILSIFATRMVNLVCVAGVIAPQFLPTLIPDPQVRAGVSMAFAVVAAFNHETAVKVEPPK